MAPNTKPVSHDEKKLVGQEELKEKLFYPSPSHSQLQVVWRNVMLFVYLHIGIVMGTYLAIFVVQWKTLIYSLFLVILSDVVGITSGAHRLWAHKTYKAKLPLRIFAMFCNCLALQNDIYEWARDHRAHHKFSETEADPHNARRGFFFSHMGWLLVKKQQEVTQLGGKIDMSDIADDPVVRFQRRFYIPLLAFSHSLMSIIIPHYVFGESLINSFYVTGLLRYGFSLHVTWLVNSVAHLWGKRPYDKNINPSEHTLVVVLANGEGWHNYHHSFPYDYKSNEYGFKINLTTAWIDMCAWLGLVYDRRTVPLDVVKSRIIRTGDGSSYQFKEIQAW